MLHINKILTSEKTDGSTLTELTELITLNSKQKMGKAEKQKYFIVQNP